MNIAEAFEALKEGKRVGRKGWHLRTWYQLKEDGTLSCGEGYTPNMVLTPADLQADNWEVFEDGNLLNQKEKEFLENVLRPYTGSYDIIIGKKTDDENQYYLGIILFPHVESDSRIEHFCLPLSGINEELMFSGLEENHLYTDNDLGLFKE